MFRLRSDTGADPGRNFGGGTRTDGHVGFGTPPLKGSGSCPLEHFYIRFCGKKGGVEGGEQ